jgi:hypothetical protein
LTQRLESSRDRVREMLTGTSDQVLGRRPADGGWTALECAEHLVLSEETLLNMVRGMLREEQKSTLPLDLQGRDGAIVAAMADRSEKRQTFDALIPRGRYSSAGSVLDAFLARRAATLDFVRTSTSALHFHAAPLDGLGLLDAYHWLLLISVHTDRHAERMREAMGS